MRVLIVDDETLARRLLLSLVDGERDLECVGEATDGDQAMHLISERAPDLVLLDVQMPRLDGVAVARQLARMPVPPMFIFITAFDAHAVSAFELEALDYLVKPIEKARFRAAIARARRAMQSRRMEALADQVVALRQGEDSAADPQGLDVRRGEQLIRLRWPEIIWIGAENQYARVHAQKGDYLLSQSLAEVERGIGRPEFLRIHRSALVNTQHVRTLRRRGRGLHQVQLSDGTELDIARSRRHLVDELLARVET